jgi:hypothetical protein
MEVSYLKVVLRAGLGTAFSENTQTELCNKPSSSGVQLQQHIQNRFPFSTALWDNEDELEDVAEEVIFDEFFGNTSPPAKPETMDDQESGAEQKAKSDRYLPKPTTDTNEEIIGEASFAQDNFLPILKKADADFHSTSELKMGRSDAGKGEKEVKVDKSGAQNIANKIDIQKPEGKTVQPKESDRIPTIEVVKQTAIRVPSSDQLSSPGLVSQLAGSNLPSQELNKNQQAQQLKAPSLQIEKSPEQLQPQTRKTRIAEPQEEQIRTPSDIARQEKIHESEAEQKIELHRYLPKPIINANGEINATFFAQDNPLPMQKKADIDLHSTSELKIGRSDVKNGEKEVKEDKSGAQNIANKIDIQKIEVKRVQSKESDGIPIKDPSLQTHKSPEQLQPQPRKSIIAEPQKKQIRTPSDMAKQKKVHEPEALMRSVKVLRKPTSQENLNAFFFTKSFKKSETQTAKIAKDIALIKKKLDEHISKEQPEPDRPVFLPKRPASRNLGGWSNLERNYIR